MSSVSSAGPAIGPDAPQTNPLSRRAQAPIVAVVAAVLFWLGLVAFYTRGNDFPFYYHTDEPSKVEQLLAGKRNFFHPQLLLLGAETLWRAGGLPKTPQGCVLAGRWTSALLAATAAVLLALLAGRLGGPGAGAAAALLSGTHPMLFELAHYMKEDCAWLCGLSATLLAATGLERRRTLGAAAWLGAAAGVAASGKYIGIVMLAAAALFIAAPAPALAAASPSPAPPPSRRRLWGALLAGFAVSFALINWMVLTHPVSALTGLREELGRMGDVAEEQSARIQWRFLHKTLKVAWPSPLLPALGFVGWMAWRTFRRRERRAVEWFCAGFALVFLAVLLVTPRIKERYLLPVVEIACVLGALGIGQLGAWAGARWGSRAAWGTVALGALLAAGTQAPDLAACWRGFHADSRRELAAFLRKNVPADALVAHDWRVALTRARQAALSPAYDFPQPTVESTRFLADLGALEDFQRRGVRYFVVTNEDYGNILNAPDTAKNADLKVRCRAFYGGLFERGKPLWQSPRGRLPYLQPDLSVYYLKAEG